MDIASHWAYRPRRDTPKFAEVIVRVVAAKERRLKVEWVADEYAGKIGWVPMSRLEVEWPKISDYAARDALRRALYDASVVTRTTDWAAEIAMTYVLPEEIGSYLTRGVLQVDDIALLSRRTGIPAEELQRAPAYYNHDHWLLPWAMAEQIIPALIARSPDAIVGYIMESEDEARRDAVLGREVPEFLWDQTGARWVDGAFASQQFQKNIAPLLVQLREWCGIGQVDAALELVATRRELSRVGNLAQRAIQQISSERARIALANELKHPSSEFDGYGASADDLARGEALFPAAYEWVLRAQTEG